MQFIIHGSGECQKHIAGNYECPIRIKVMRTGHETTLPVGAAAQSASRSSGSSERSMRGPMKFSLRGAPKAGAANRGGAAGRPTKLHKILGSSITVTAWRLRINPGATGTCHHASFLTWHGQSGRGYLPLARPPRSRWSCAVGRGDGVRPPAGPRKSEEGRGLGAVDWDVVGVGCSKTSMNTQCNLRNTWSKT